MGYRLEVYLDDALSTGHLVPENRSDEEVITITNTFKEAMESPQVT